jgi:hypothetical protein
MKLLYMPRHLLSDVRTISTRSRTLFTVVKVTTVTLTECVGWLEAQCLGVIFVLRRFGSFVFADRPFLLFFL